MDGPFNLKKLNNKFRYMLEQPESLKSLKDITLLKEKSLKLVNQQEIDNSSSSSETTRETSNLFNFDDFYLLRVKKISKQFLIWFVGFTEGNGSFIVSKDRLFFIISQKEERVLLTIRSTLGFGKVSKYSGIFRYVVTKPDRIKKLFYIFNGNLVLNKTNLTFSLWNRQLTLKPKLPLINFSNNAWFSGFAAAKACFNTLIQKNESYKLGFKFSYKFALIQEDEFLVLESISKSFKTGTVNVNKKGIFIYSVESFKGCNILIDYFNKYPLIHFSKTITFKKWKKYLNYISLEPKINLNLLKLQKLSKSTNKQNDEDIVQAVKEI